LGSNQDNFQLHRFTKSENIAKTFGGLLFRLTLYMIHWAVSALVSDSIIFLCDL